MIAAIVAIDADWGIGYKGELLEKIPEDLKRFKELTIDEVVVMGRKTWDSLPTKPLAYRMNLVISNSTKEIWKGGNAQDGDAIVRPYNEILSYFMDLHSNNKDIFIIGGASIYEQLLSYCDTIYLTRIDKHHENVDTYFPNFFELGEWELTECSGIKLYNDILYQFETWRRCD